MRPLIVMSGLAAGGAERVTVAFLRKLAEEGRPVPLCTLTARTDGAPAEEAAAAGLVRYDLGARRLVAPVVLVRLLRLLHRERIDLVHAHGQDASILAAWARRLASFHLVVTRHVIDEPATTRRERLRSALSIGALRRCDAVVAVSEAVAADLHRRRVLPHDRIHRIPNGVDLDAFDPQRHGSTARAFRESVGVPPGDPVVLLPAVLRPGKGHELLLDAVPLVLRSVPDARFLLAGDGELADELRRKASPLGDRVLFLGHREDMPVLMAAADVVVLPSRSEALPTVALEAAAAGRPLVATRVGGVPEVVEDGLTGVLVPGGDVDALAEALTELLVDPEQRAVLGRAARERALADFGIDRQVDRTLELWERVGGGAGS